MSKRETKKNNNINNDNQSKKLKKPQIAGIMLILAAILSLISWGQVFFIDESTIEEFAEDNPEFEKYTQNTTAEEIIQSQRVCAIVGIIISILLILAAILSFKAKMWLVAIIFTLTGIALFIVFMFIIQGVISIVALVILILSRKEFTQDIKLDFIKNKIKK